MSAARTHRFFAVVVFAVPFVFFFMDFLVDFIFLCQ